MTKPQLINLTFAIIGTIGMLSGFGIKVELSFVFEIRSLSAAHPHFMKHNLRKQIYLSTVSQTKP